MLRIFRGIAIDFRMSVLREPSSDKVGDVYRGKGVYSRFIDWEKWVSLLSGHETGDLASERPT
jgi:hypothetical protein